MRFYLDTEFWERPGSIQLISLALVADDGRTLYVENADFIWGECTSEWLHENVKPNLQGGEYAVPYENIGQMIQDFIGKVKPEIWAYYSSYDWVTFCWTFGSMMDLPKGYPMFCMDLKQVVYSLGNPALPPQYETEHNALQDALWLRSAHQYILSYL